MKLERELADGAGWKIRSVLETAIERRAGFEQFVERLPRGFPLPERRRGGKCPRRGGKVQTFKLSGRTGYCPGCK